MAEGIRSAVSDDGSRGEQADRMRMARIALAHLIEPGNRELGMLVDRVGPIDALRKLITGRVPSTLRDVCTQRLGRRDPLALAQDATVLAARLGARIVTPEDAEWPSRLDELRLISQPERDSVRRDTYPPHAVWLRGPLPLAALCDRSVAVVGARASTAYGQHVATDFGYGLAERGWTVVSGGAFGIDAAAHRGALAAGGPTIAVLACGIDRPYPLSHTTLFEQVSAVGLLLSEWPPGADPHRHRFLVRNRVIAALARATVVVEASVRSGARFTMSKARQLNRVCLAVPGPVTSVMSAGCHEELRGDMTILAANVAHVIDAAGRIGDDMAVPARAEPTARDLLTGEQLRVLDGVRPRKILTAEQIAGVVGVPAALVRRAIPDLIDAGFVVSDSGGYRLSRKSDGHGSRPRRAAGTEGRP